MLDRPLRTIGTTVALAVVFFVISASGQKGSFWSSGPGWLGAIGWFAFLLLLLALLVEVVTLAVRATRNRRSARSLS